MGRLDAPQDRAVICQLQPYYYRLKMVKQFHVEGFQEFENKISEIEKSENDVFVLFSGSKNASGESWCSDCVSAEPEIEKAFKEAPANSTLIHVSVGDSAFWKDPNCIFRTNDKTKLTCVPTLMKWGTRQRLLEDQCSNLDTILLMFED